MHRAALLERCAVRIQTTWRATAEARNVAWIRLINDDARRRHAARESFQLRSARGDFKVVGATGAANGESLLQILREAQQDILASVRKCFHGRRVVVEEMAPAAKHHKHLRDVVHQRLGPFRAKTQAALVFKVLSDKAHHQEKQAEAAESMWEMLATSLGTVSADLSCQLADFRRLRSPTTAAKESQHLTASRGLGMFRRAPLVSS